MTAPIGGDSPQALDACTASLIEALLRDGLDDDTDQDEINRVIGLALETTIDPSAKPPPASERTRQTYT